MQLESTLTESLKLLTAVNNNEVSVTGFDVNMLNLQFYVNATLDIQEVSNKDVKFFFTTISSRQ